MFKNPNPQTCERCPNRYRKEGCPSWIKKDLGILEKNGDQQRLMEGCYFEVMPKLMAYVLGAVEKNSASVQSHRNVIAEGFSSILRLHDDQQTDVIQITAK